MSRFTVHATSLRLRRAPRISPDNVIASLPSGHEVDVIDQDDAAWWAVRTTLRGKEVRGFAAARYLRPLGKGIATAAAITIAPVHSPLSPRARLDAASHRHSPLPDSVVARRDRGADSAARTASMHAIVRTLDVETSKRYLPTPTSTYCNIYAYDVCYFAAAYLPRVWWTSKALIQLSKGAPVTPSYGKTIHELNANALHDWLDEWGTDFGWQPTFELGELQDRVNGGGVGVIVAKRRDPQRHGHITCVVPEAPGLSARRSGNRVVAPLQSQAGTRNQRYFADDWWVRRGRAYRSVGYWVHP